MSDHYVFRCARLAPILLSLACGGEATDRPTAPSAEPSVGEAGAPGAWSTPVNLGPPINTAARELSPALSPDELSLYFVSDRPGGLGERDIWVSRRACTDWQNPQCAWGDPVNLGPAVNSAALESCATLSRDGHRLFFCSVREGGFGIADIYMARRVGSGPEEWEAAVHVGPPVNTELSEGESAYFPGAGPGSANMYLSRANPALGDNGFDLYSARITRRGTARGSVDPVEELNSAGFADFGPTVSLDGTEIVFSSTRPGGIPRPPGTNPFQDADLWTSTRPSVHHPWSQPVNVGAPVNSERADITPNLSRDGRTLLFASIRAGGAGAQDIWVSVRERHPAP